MRWDLHRFQTMESLEYFSSYLHLANAQIEEAHHLALSAINRASESDFDKDSYSRESAIDWCNKEYESEYIPKTRYSLVVLLFTILETRMQALCSEIQKREGYDLGWKDITGASIERLAKYLHHVAHVTDKNDDLWIQLNELVSIRNCIVHANGNISEANERTRAHIRSVIARRNDVLLSEDGMLLITTEFLHSTATLIQALFSATFEKARFGPEKPIF